MGLILSFLLAQAIMLTVLWGPKAVDNDREGVHIVLSPWDYPFISNQSLVIEGGHLTTNTTPTRTKLKLLLQASSQDLQGWPCVVI